MRYFCQLGGTSVALFATLGVVLKYQDDIARVRGDVAAQGVIVAKKAAC
jgi:hypothetical protein